MPATQIGFVLLTHRDTVQAIRLIRRLNMLYDSPPIALHHDSSQCPLDESTLPSNVQVVHPHVRTRWGDWSLVESTLRALRLLYRGGGPDWFVLLSGADYPVVCGDVALRDLRDGGADAYMEIVPVPPKPLVPRSRNERDWEFQKRHYRKMFEFRVPFSQPPRYRRLFLPRWMSTPFIPFNDGFRCFAGSQWFAANRNCIDAIERFERDERKRAAFFRGARIPDESYFQCILANAPGIRIRPTNFRYIEWPPKARNPKTLRAADIASIVASGAHFARKVDPSVDGELLRLLDDESDRSLQQSRPALIRTNASIMT